jgi:hypothetical protein
MKNNYLKTFLLFCYLVFTPFLSAVNTEQDSMLDITKAFFKYSALYGSSQNKSWIS